jgi:microcystin-dependent protein
VAETLTPNYSWTKPDPGASANTWGATLNKDLDGIDAQVFANQQAGSHVGDIKMFAGATAPTNWLNCDGSSYSTTGTYAALFSVIGYAYGGSGANFNVPNLQGRFPVGLGGGYGMGAAGGEATHVLAWGEMPVHAHPIEQTPHSHGVGDPTHAHGVSDPTHSHGATQDAHNHSVTINGSFGFGVGPSTPPNPMMNQGSSGYTTSTAQPAVHINAAGTGIGVQGAATGVTVAAAYANINGNTTDNAGSGGAHNNLPPYVCVNFVIRFQ